MIIGQPVSFISEFKNEKSGREYVHLFLEKQNVGEEMARQGWVKVRQRNGKREPTGEYADYLEAGKEAEEAKRGVHQPNPDGLKGVRKLVTNFDSYAIFSKLQGSPQQVVIEQVREGSTLRGYLLPTFHWVTIQVAGVASPVVPYDPRQGKELAPQPFFREAKFYTEMCLLGRSATVNFTGVDKGKGMFFGTLSHSDHDLGTELLRSGLGHYVEWSAPLDRRAQYAAIEKEAKQRKVRMWSVVQGANTMAGPSVGAAASSSASSPSATPKEFNGKVVEIRGNGELVVAEKRAGNETQLHSLPLASLQVPRMGRSRDQDEPWAWEAKEFLRSKLRGKTVRVRHAYTRPAIKTSSGQELPERDYYSVFQGKADIAKQLVERGFAKVINHRDNEERSPSYGDLLLAEASAKKKSKGVHAPSNKVPIHRVTDLSRRASSSTAAASNANNNNKNNKNSNNNEIVNAGKRFLPFLQRAGRVKATVEYVYGADRYKLFVPSQHVILNFTLTGVRCVREPLATTDRTPANALLFVKDAIHQADVEVEVEAQDKIGTFIGNLWGGPKQLNIATSLLERGFARIHGPSANRSRYASDYRTAEQAAKAKRVGVWKYWDEEAELEKKRAAEAAAAAAANNNSNNLSGSSHHNGVVGGGMATPGQQQWMRVKVTDIVEAGWFYVHVLNEQLEQLAPLMAAINASAPGSTPSPAGFAPKKADVVLAQFAADNKWYRAEVRRYDKQQQLYSVLYIDYGNCDRVPAERIRPVRDASFMSLPPQAQECVLAYVRAPAFDEEYGEEATEAFHDLVWDKPELVANIERREGKRLVVSLGDPSTNLLINGALVRKGFALVEERRDSHLRSLLAKLQKEQEAAHISRAGMWRYGDFREDD